MQLRLAHTGRVARVIRTAILGCDPGVLKDQTIVRRRSAGLAHTVPIKTQRVLGSGLN